MTLKIFVVKIGFSRRLVVTRGERDSILRLNEIFQKFGVDFTNFDENHSLPTSREVLVRNSTPSG
jgi:hypothetical protein